MKIFFRLLLLSTIIMLSACEGPMGPEGPPGQDGHSTEWWFKDITITRNQWDIKGEPDQIGSYLTYVTTVPELTEDIYYDGAIICYYRFINEDGIEVQTTLPHTVYGILDDGGYEVPYSEYYSFDVTPTTRTETGTIALKITYSDFYTAEWIPPVSCTFRLVLIY